MSTKKLCSGSCKLYIKVHTLNKYGGKHCFVCAKNERICMRCSGPNGINIVEHPKIKKFQLCDKCNEKKKCKRCDNMYLSISTKNYDLCYSCIKNYKCEICNKKKSPKLIYNGNNYYKWCIDCYDKYVLYYDCGGIDNKVNNSIGIKVCELIDDIFYPDISDIIKGYLYTCQNYVDCDIYKKDNQKKCCCCRDERSFHEEYKISKINPLYSENRKIRKSYTSFRHTLYCDPCRDILYINDERSRKYRYLEDSLFYFLQ